MAGSYKGIWKKRVLLPLWIVQLLALVVMLGITALAFGVWNRVQDDVNNYPELSDEVGDTDTFNKAVDANVAINFSVCIFTILMVFVEIVLFCTGRLAPVANIVMQSIKSAIWTVYLLVSIVYVVRDGGAGGLILVLAIFLTSIGLLAYGAQIVHQHRKGTLRRGQYAAASQGHTSYEPNRHSQTTGYAGAAAPNPFRDPSPTPPYNPHGTQGANHGAAGEYYGGGGSYEMQHGARKV